jgi:fused signal recognition particle receptor
VRKDELASAEAALDREHQELAETRVVLESAVARREGLAGDANAFEANEQEIDRLKQDVRRRQLVIAKAEAQVVATQDALALATCEAAGDALGRAYAARRKASKVVADHLADLADAAAELEKRRLTVAKLEAELQALAVDGYEWPAGADEHGWPQSEATLELIAAGPVQPELQDAATLAAAEQRAERRAEDEARRAAEEAVREGDFRHLEALDPAGRHRAVTAAERFLDEDLARRRRLAGEATHLATGGRQTADVIATLERRLERIRSLAGAPAVADVTRARHGRSGLASAGRA